MKRAFKEGVRRVFVSLLFVHSRYINVIIINGNGNDIMWLLINVWEYFNLFDDLLLFCFWIHLSDNNDLKQKGCVI